MAPSTSASVVRPLLCPEPNCVILNTAPPKLPDWVLRLFAVAVVSFRVPLSVLISAPAGIARTWVRGTNAPLT
jgi:hypothetical protein